MELKHAVKLICPQSTQQLPEEGGSTLGEVEHKHLREADHSLQGAERSHLGAGVDVDYSPWHSLLGSLGLQWHKGAGSFASLRIR